MNKGLSWRQLHMLNSIAREATRWSKEHRKRPVACRAIDHGSTSAGANDDHQSARAQWNVEQAVRRSLRSLQGRGLVKLGRCCFYPVAYMNRVGGTQIFWNYVCRRHRVTGETRIMTGVLLTDAGWAMVAEEQARGQGTVETDHHAVTPPAPPAPRRRRTARIRIPAYATSSMLLTDRK
jgi:hypothetical protein